MGVLEILMLGLALSMDACAVSMTNGMTDSKMPPTRALTIGGLFGFFQFLMPVVGYFVTGIVANAFLGVFQRVSAWVSFALLAFLGGRMLLESIRQMRCRAENPKARAVCETPERASVGKLMMQAIATSIDALAVGVSLQMAALSEAGLALGVWGATLTIGAVTFTLSVAAVYIGKAVGNKLLDKAGFLGGVVLLAIGLKILIEGLLG